MRKYSYEINRRLAPLMKILVVLFVSIFLWSCGAKNKGTLSQTLDITKSVPKNLKPFVKKASYEFTVNSDNDEFKMSLELNNGTKLTVNLNDYGHLNLANLTKDMPSIYTGNSPQLINLITQVFPIIAPSPSTSCQPIT